MKRKSCNKLYSWLILIGISLQTFSPLIAAVSSQNIKPVIMPQKGTAGESIVIHSNEDQDVNENSQETISLHEFGVAEIVVRVVEDAIEEGLEEELSESLVKCYRSVIEEDGIVDADTAIQAMPELLEYTVEAEKLLHRDRAVRPNAPSITDNNAIAGCGGDCDLTPLLRLLSSIRARIGSVKDSPCCGTILGILGDACNVPCIGEDGSISEVLCEILDCCTNISDISGVFTVLDEGFACSPTPLFQSDVDEDGEIKLTETGINYCLAENITGTIVISGANVTVDGNDRVVTGRVEIRNEKIILKNAKVKPQAPTTVAEAMQAGIEVTLTGSQAQIINCLVECDDTTTTVGSTGIDGRTAILSAAVETIIKQCVAKAGSGSLEIDGFLSSNGGNGIKIIGNNGIIIQSIGEGNAGGFGSDALGGPGGNGIDINALNCSIHKSKGIGGLGGDADQGNSGGNGGTGIKLQGGNHTITKSKAFGGNGGNGDDFGGTGGSGIALIDVDTGNVKSCSITGGGIGGDGIASGGGGGGNGVLIQTSTNIQVCECKINNVGVAGIGTPNGTPGNGIQIDDDSICIQVVSNRVACCNGIGINNEAGTESTLYNNIATDNAGGNYSGVPFVRTPGPQTGFYVNVTDGPEDCDLCGLYTVLNSLDITATIEVDLSGVFTVLDEGFGCNPVPLFQSDVDGDGEIKLTETGINYCLAENITGTIVITGANVTVDGNDRVITGRVEIRNEEIILKNAKVKPQAPLNEIQAGEAAIEVFGAGSTNVQIINCFIECSDTVVIVGLGAAGINGRSGIVSAAAETLVENCIIKAGAGGNGGNDNIAGDGGNGGDGIELNGDNSIVRGSIATAGDGGNGGDDNLSPAGAGGNGGDGIKLNGNNDIVRESIATAGDGGNGGDNSGIAGAGGNGGDGGIAIQSTLPNTTIIESQAVGGNGGSGGDNSVAGAGGNGGAGGTAIQSNSSNITIIESQAVGGNGNIAGNGGSLAAGTGGNGASGITLNDDVASLVDLRIVGGDGSVGGDSTSDEGGAGGNGGSALEVFGDNVTVKGSRITPGNGGIPGTGDVDEGAGGNGGNGILISDSTTIMVKECCILDGADGAFSTATIGENGDGISIVSTSSDVQICDCKINNLGAILNNVTGAGIYIDNTSESVQIARTDILAHADHGILIEGDCVTILDCSLVENGGSGLSFEGASNCQVTNCVSECNVDNGFFIDSLSSNIEIVNGSAIGNTGALGGFAIDGNSCMFKNCTAIENSDSGFNLTSNSLSNMFIDCNSSTNSGSGFNLASSANNMFTNCNSSTNSNSGFNLVSNSVNNMFIDCNSSINSGSGFNLTFNSANNMFTGCNSSTNLNRGFIIAGDDCTLKNCNAVINNNNGFEITDETMNVSLIACDAHSNVVHGFKIDGLDCLVENCNAVGNDSDGFNIGSAIVATNCSVISCRATSNGDNGFFGIALNSRYVNNYAANNTTNDYSGVSVRTPIAVTTMSADLSYWDNVIG